MAKDKDTALMEILDYQAEKNVCKIILVDDEPDAIKILTHLLKAYDSIFKIVSICFDISTARQQIKKESPHLVFLDIRMPGGSGLQLASEIQELSPKTKIIFTSAYHEYLKEGYKVQPFDFLTKPISPDELKASLARFIEKCSLANAKESLVRAFIPTARGRQAFYFNDIHHIQYLDRKSFVYQSSGVISSSVLSLNGFLEILPKGKFLRLNKHAIINLDFISVINRNVVELKPFGDNMEIFSFVVGRAFMPDLKKFLETIS